MHGPQIAVVAFRRKTFLLPLYDFNCIAFITPNLIYHLPYDWNNQKKKTGELGTKEQLEKRLDNISNIGDSPDSLSCMV